MPIVLDPSRWDAERARTLLRSQGTDLRETAEALGDPRLPVRDPASLRTARDLVDDLLALGEAADGFREATPELLVRVANVQYDGLLAAIDLMKSHADIPKVPRHRD